MCDAPKPTTTAYSAKMNHRPVRPTDPSRAIGMLRRGFSHSSATVVDDSKPKNANRMKMNASQTPDSGVLAAGPGARAGVNDCGDWPSAPPVRTM